MKIQLLNLALLVFGLSAAVEKPGSCPDVSKTTFGACVIACGEDTHCKDFKKCCSTGCGQLCSDPACPAGVSKVKCPQSLCRFSQCPNAPDALCRIDSCGQCNVEYYNKTTWEKITCTDNGQNLCKRMRDYAVKNPLLGRYTPACTTEGKFKSIQQMGSRVFCVDKETGIPDFTTETGVGRIRELDCTKKAKKSDCELAKEAAMKLPTIGRFVPSCKADGSYQEKQCHGSTGFCWCVDEKGREWFGSRKRGQVECPRDMCPAGVKNVQNCDPMICATASCPGHPSDKVTCRINPCGQCKAEFLDKNHRRVNCQTCANKRAELLGKKDRPLIGEFVPECEVSGNYKEIQCWGSVGYCWCVDRVTGAQIDGTMTRGTPKCRSTTTLLLGSKRPDPDVPKPSQPVCPSRFPMMMCLRNFCQWSKGCAANAKATCRVNPCKMCAVEYFDENNKLIDCNQDMSECQLKRADAFSSKYIGLQPVGRFIPTCEKDGNYSRIQCWGSTGYCWCVDPKTGVEQELTRVRGKPNCATKTPEKPVKLGRCPTVKPSDTCSSKCTNDNDCSGKAKCCQVGCGKTCREPAEDQLACPNGKPFLLCLHHCQLASCPAHPDAQCNVDPCRMCKVEFKDSSGNVVNCSEKLTACQLQKAQSPGLLGSYTPQCEKDGSYSPKQCHGSTGYCWCVDQNGQEIDNTRNRGAVNCTGITTKKVLTKCEQMRLKASMRLGAKKPQCEADGSFKQVQSWEGYQWCVDVNGIELPGTRVGRGKPSPDCTKACKPVMCMMYCLHGFVKDSRGCEICRCNSAPSKHGICPKSPSTDVGCSEDLECPGTMKCCERKCSVPDIYVKPGYCPPVNTSHVGDCTSECAHDVECKGDMKCCASGCSRKCVAPGKEVCPNGAPLVMCLRNMCDNVVCPAYPEASCRMNYCGHCSAEFVFPNGSIVDCGKPDEKSRVQCENKNKTMYFCSSASCEGQTCARNPKATCRVPPLSCDCAAEFYDEDGNKVDCLTECQRKRKDLETGPLLLGAYKPSCEDDGTYSLVQCHGSTGYCWCAFPDGTEWPGTRVRGQPDCSENKKPNIRSVHVRLSLDAKFDNIKDSLEDFKTVLIDHLKGKFGIHPKQVKNLKVSSGSIIVEFELYKHEEGRDIRNASSQLRDVVLEGTFVIEFGGEAMVAKPESYQATSRLASKDKDESSSTPVLGIALGVVFGMLAVILIVGVVLLVRRRRERDRGMSVNTCDSSRPMKDHF